MQERCLYRVVGGSLFSLLSVLVLAVIVAEHETPATSSVTPVLPEVEQAHDAPRKKPARKSTTVAVAQPTLLAAVDHPDIRPEHRLLADRILRALPSGCDKQLKNFYIRYDNPKQRGLGGKETIIVAGTTQDGKALPAEEIAALIVHECGHLAHGAMAGSPTSGDSGFRDGQQTFYADSPIVSFFLISWESDRILRSGSDANDFASGYAKSDCFEDFAEFFAAYILQRPSLIERAKTNNAIARKLQWMDTYMPTPLHGVIESGYTWNGKVPWDITKLPYSWPILQVAKAA